MKNKKTIIIIVALVVVALLVFFILGALRNGPQSPEGPNGEHPPVNQQR